MVGGMRALSDFPPIDSGHVGLTWIASACSQCDGSDVIETSNFDAALDRLDAIDPYGVDWGVVRWPIGLPNCAWMEVIFARPGSAAVKELGLIRDELSYSSVLDSDLYMRRAEWSKEDSDAA